MLLLSRRRYASHAYVQRNHYIDRMYLQNARDTKLKLCKQIKMINNVKIHQKWSKQSRMGNIYVVHTTRGDSWRATIMTSERNIFNFTVQFKSPIYMAAADAVLSSFFEEENKISISWNGLRSNRHQVLLSLKSDLNGGPFTSLSLMEHVKHIELSIYS